MAFGVFADAGGQSLFGLGNQASRVFGESLGGFGGEERFFMTGSVGLAGIRWLRIDRARRRRSSQDVGTI